MSNKAEKSTETLGRLVWTYVIEQCTVIIDAEAGLRSHAPVVHDTRVAIRRLRSTLRVFADVVDVPRAAALGDELGWFAGVLGVVRDLEVLEERLTAQLAELPPELVLGPVRSSIGAQIQLERQEAWRAITASLDTDRYRGLVAELRRWRSDPPLTAVAERPATAVKAYVKQAGKKVDKRLRQAAAAWQDEDPAAGELLHRARKAGKRHRYAIELGLDVLGRKGEQRIADRKALQDVLGEHQDGVVSLMFLRTEGARLGSRSGHNGFTYGLMHAQESAYQARLMDRLDPLLG